MNTTTVNVGDVYVADRADCTFSKLVVIAAMSGYHDKWRTRATNKHTLATATATIYGTTLRNKYKLQVSQDFNVNTESYPRPMGYGGRPVIDLPAVPTALIRDDVSVPKFIGINTTTLLHVTGVTLRQAKSKAAKVELLLNATDGYMLLAVPGTYSMDVFFVDSREAALEALGLRKAAPAPAPQMAADGSAWVAA